MEKAAAASGSRFAYLLGDLVLVELALVRFAVELVGARGLRPGRPAGAGPRGAAVRDRLLPRRAGDDLRGPARRAVPGRHLGGLAGRAPRRRDPRRRRAAAPLRRASRPASGARPARPARTRAGSSASTSSTRSRCSRSSRPRTRAAEHERLLGDPGADPPGARAPLPGGRHRGRRPRRRRRRASSTARPGSPARSATARSPRARTPPTTRRAGSAAASGPSPRPRPCPCTP